MTRRFLLAANVALALGCNGLASAQAEYRLAEHLGYAWTNELISFPVAFPEQARYAATIWPRRQAMSLGVPIPGGQIMAACLPNHAGLIRCDAAARLDGPPHPI